MFCNVLEQSRILQLGSPLVVLTVELSDALLQGRADHLLAANPTQLLGWHRVVVACQQSNFIVAFSKNISGDVVHWIGVKVKCATHGPHK